MVVLATSAEYESSFERSIERTYDIYSALVVETVRLI